LEIENSKFKIEKNQQNQNRVGETTMNIKTTVVKQARRARAAALILAALPAKTRVRALKAMAAALIKNSTAILAANRKDLAVGRAKGLSTAMLDRLMLDQTRVQKMARALLDIARQSDPVGKIEEMKIRPQGFRLGKMRVPIGVVAIIYEARPNVTADAAGLCVKSGNAVILKGGSESIHSNRAMVKVLCQAARGAGLPDGAIEFIDTTDRTAVTELLHLADLIDVVIPRGGKGLIKTVMEESYIPVIKHYDGICHVYVDDRADLNMAEQIVLNAKVQRPAVCNAMETLLLSKKLPGAFITRLLGLLAAKGVQIRGDRELKSYLPGVRSIAAADWRTEYLDLVLAVKLVKNMDAAIDHINTYGSRHTDAIVTRNKARAQEFINRVDSSSVMWNASTRLSDGGVYGLGAEVGISTDKLHARGPMGVRDLTTYKWVLIGKGTVRT
jgi:glutamate-5-semialdehyde dehydrogenase